MNPSALDLIIRSITTAALALGVLMLVAYEAIHSGAIDGETGAAFGLIIGVYFGAHVSQNGSAVRARRDQIIAAEALGNQPPGPEVLRPPTNPPSA